jgi:hypothetical protein
VTVWNSTARPDTRAEVREFWLGSARFWLTEARIARNPANARFCLVRAARARRRAAGYSV